MAAHLNGTARAGRTVAVAVAAVGLLLALAAAAHAQQTLPEAPLTIRVSGPRGAVTRTLALQALGPQPPVDTVLVDDQGRHAVTVHVLPPDSSDCATSDERRTGLGTDRWCMTLAGIAAGHQFSGRLVGAASIVSLTVTARHSWPLPTAVAVSGLLLAVALVGITTQYLPDLTTRLLLKLELRDLDGIGDLDTWASRSVGRLSQADVLARVRWAKRYGRARVAGARSALEKAIGDPASAIPDCPLRQAAVAETARDDVNVSDLLTEGGMPTTSRAEQLLGLVERAEGAISAFRQIADGMLARIPPDDPNRVVAVRLRDEGGGLAEGYLSELTIDSFETTLRDLLGEIEQLAQDAHGGGAGAPAGLAAVALGAGRAWFPTIPRLGPAAAVVARATVAAGVVVLAAGLLMVVAVVAVLGAAYFPNETFGTAKDYVGLALAALGSSSAVGIATVLLLVRGPADWFG